MHAGTVGAGNESTYMYQKFSRVYSVGRKLRLKGICEPLR